MECLSKEEIKYIERDDYSVDCEEDDFLDFFDDDFIVEEVGLIRIKRICMENNDIEEGDIFSMIL